MILLAIVLIVCSVSIGLSIIQLIANPYSKFRQYLMGFLFSASIAILFVNLQDIEGFSDLWLFRLAIMASIAMALYLRLFAEQFTLKLMSPWTKVVQVVLCLVLIALSTTSLVTESITPTIVDGVKIGTKVNRGYVYPIAIAYILILPSMGLVSLWQKSKEDDSHKAKQSAYIFYVILAGFVGAIITSVILPNVLAQGTTPGRFAFIPISIWSFFLSRLIIKHRFVDLRLLLTRGISIVLSLGIFTLLFYGATYALIRFALNSDTSAWPREYQIVMFAIAVILGSAFPLLLHFIDNATDKYLYRRTYDTTQVLYQITRIGVTEFEVEKVAERALSIMRMSFRPIGLWLVVVSHRDNSLNIYGDKNPPDALHRLPELITDQKLINATLYDINYSQVIDQLKVASIGAVAPLGIGGDVIGYIVLGDKSNKAIYGAHDEKTINSIKDQLAISIQSARRYDEIKRFNETLNTKVQIATSELQTTNEKLELAAKEIAASKREIENIVSSIDEAIFGLNSDGIVMFANAGAQNILNSHTTPVGHKLEELLSLEKKSGGDISLGQLLADYSLQNSEQTLIVRYSEKDYIVVSVIVKAATINQAKGSSDSGYVIVMRDITEQTTSQEERHAYISLLSHELRTPLAYIEGQISFLQLLLKDSADAKVTHAVDDAHAQTINLTSIVNQLGRYIEADTNQEKVSEQEVNVVSLATGILNEYRSTAEDKGLELRIDSRVDVQDGKVNSNEVYIRSILNALIDNAVKFTDEGSVSIQISNQEGRLRIDVVDTGVGVSKHHQLKIFESGKQVEDFETRTKGGLGLSLYTASRLAKQIGAELTIESEVGSGSTFSLLIPTTKDR